MGRTVANTIRELTKRHIDSGQGVVIGQCLSAVGWVQNTVPPQVEGTLELPMTDVAGAGIAVGISLTGLRPIFVIRFQSFLWLSASPLVNYAAKSKELFGYPAPVFIRAIGSEGGGSGPVHTNCFHSIFMHVPGMPVCAPMTPGEYEAIWNHFLAHDDPLFVSEHRRSYLNTEEIPDPIEDGAEITLYAMSTARFTATEAVAELRSAGIRCNLVNIIWLKPFALDERILAPLKASCRGIVLDSAYEIAGAARSIAYDLMIATGHPVRALGQEDRSPGVIRRLENGTPTVGRILNTVKDMLPPS